MDRQEGLRRLIAILMNKDEEEWAITLKKVIREALDQAKAIEYEEARDAHEFSSIPAFMQWLGIKKVGFGYDIKNDKFQPVFENGIGMIPGDRIFSFFISNDKKLMMIDNFDPHSETYIDSRHTSLIMSDVDLSPVVSLLEEHGIMSKVRHGRAHLRTMWMISGRHLLLVGPPRSVYGNQTMTVFITTREGMDGAISFGMDTTTGEEYITMSVPYMHDASSYDIVVKDQRHIDAITSWIYGDKVIATKDAVSIPDRERLPEDGGLE